MRTLSIIFIFLFSAEAALCQQTTPEEYISEYKDIAISEMRRTGVPAAITLAQGLLESESGNSELLKRSNNHFGIKCKNTWSGPSVKHTDDSRNECFRAYKNAEDSYRDHSDFLKNNSRYAFLFNLEPTDYKDWAKGLKKAGYATNPRYADILIKNIEKYDLEKYTVDGILPDFSSPQYNDYASVDGISPSSFPGANQQADQNKSEKQVNSDQGTLKPGKHYPEYKILRKVTINHRKALQVPTNTSLLSLAMKFHIRLSKLLEINDLQSDGLLPYSQIIFLEKKKTEGEHEFLLALENESLYEIAQRNGVQLSYLCNYNACEPGQQFSQGDTVYLRTPAVLTHAEPQQPKSSAGTAQVAPSKIIHTVAPREGLYAISKKYGVTLTQLKNWNHLSDDRLQVGQTLIIAK